MKNKLIASLVLVFALQVAAVDWPHWRGPRHDGVSVEKNLPTEWAEDKNVVWKLPIKGSSSATPIVFAGKVFTMAELDKQVLLIAVDLKGKELWRTPVGTGNGTGSGERTLASPTPSADSRHIYTMTGNGDVAATKFDGKPAWSFNAQERYGRFRLGFGFHTTPLLFQGRLYLQLIHSGGAWVVAIDTFTGKEVWKVERKSDGVAECEHSYASPCAVAVGDTFQIVTHGNDYAIGHDPANGKELWRVGDLNHKDRYNRTLRFVASPVAHGDLVVIPTAKNRGVAAISVAGAKGYIGTGGKGEVWRIDRGTPDVPSPVIYNNLVYLCRENGTVTCLDAKTGEQLYSESPHRQTYRASPVAGDGKIYITSRDGMVTVLQAGREFKVLSKNKLAGGLTASPAPSNGRIYLRTHEALYAIGRK